MDMDMEVLNLVARRSEVIGREKGVIVMAVAFALVPGRLSLSWTDPVQLPVSVSTSEV